MSGTQYTLLAYVLGLGLMLGYALMMRAEWGRVARQRKYVSKAQGRLERD